MIPVLFKEDEQIFTHNGIGALYESLSCDVLEEENGAFTMELEYPVDGELFSEIKDFRIIQAKPNDIDEPHNFRIYEIEKSIDELTVYVRANTRTNDLGNNLITNYVGKDITPQQAMNGIKSNLIEPTNFDLISDIQTKSNVEWTRINPLNAIVGVRGSLVDIWGGEIKRTNTAIHLYSRRGRDNVVTIRPGKNIEGLNMTVSTAGLVTKILPTYTYRPVDVPKYQMITNSDGTKEKRRVQNSGTTTLRDDITVLGDVVSSKYVDNYPTNYWSSVDYGDDDDLKNKVDAYIDNRLTAAEKSPTILDMSGFENDVKNFVKDELDKKAKQYFTHRNPSADKPTVRIKVDMLQLSDSPDWEEFKNLERIGLTDTLDVWVEEYNIDVEVRVTSLTYDSIAEHVIGFNAGSDRAPRQSAVEKKYDDLTKATNDYITSFKNGIQNVMRNTADGLNRKFEGYTEPPAELSSEGDIWFKEIGEGKVEIWIHDGVYWQPLMTEEFGKQIEAEVDAAMSDAEEALLKANEVSDDINTAIQNAGFTSLPEAILEIQEKMDTARFDQEILDIVTDVNSAKDDASQALTEAQKKVNTIDFDNIVNDIETGVQEAMDEAELATNTLRDSTGQLIKSQDLKVDIDGITSSLTSYAKTTDLNGLATETFVTNKGYQTAAQVSTTLTAYEKTAAVNTKLAGKANVGDIPSLTGYAKESWVENKSYATAASVTTSLKAYEKITDVDAKLANKANSSDIPSIAGLASETWVENKSYATAASVTTQLSSYAKTSQLTGLATEKFVTNKGYQTAAQVSTTLSSYAKTSQLTGLATETFVTSKGYQTASQVSTTLSSYVKTSTLSGYATVSTVNAIKSTADTNKATISTNTGKISTIEQNVSGLQTTVASKASQSQVTQLANGLSSVVTQSVKSFEVYARNYNAGPRGYIKGPDNNTLTGGSVSNDRNYMMVVIDQNDVVVHSGVYDLFNSQSEVDRFISRVENYNENFLFIIVGSHAAEQSRRLGIKDTIYNLGGSPEVFEEMLSVRSSYVLVGKKGLGVRNGYENHAVTNGGYLKMIIPVKNGASSLLGDFNIVSSQITQLSDNINLRVKKGDVVSQLNIDANRTLISSSKILLNANTVTISGTAWMSGAVIKDATITNAKIADATIASAKIASLDVSKISGNTANFVQAAFNSINNTISIDGSSINVSRTDGARSARLTVRGYEFWLAGSQHGSLRVQSSGLTTGPLANKNYVGIYAEQSAYAGLIYAGPDNRDYNALAVMGDTGRVHVFTELDMNNSRIFSAHSMSFASGSTASGWIDSGATHASTDLRIMANESTLRLGIGNPNKFREFMTMATNIQVLRAINMNGNAITNQSDERLKRDIKDTTINSLKSIKHMRFVGFNWKDDEMDSRLGRQFGVIAQNTPELSIYDRESDSWTINSSKQIMMNSHAIQQQYELHKLVAQVAESNEDKIHDLQMELSKANARITELEGAM